MPRADGSYEWINPSDGSPYYFRVCRQETWFLYLLDEDKYEEVKPAASWEDNVAVSESMGTYPTHEALMAAFNVLRSINR